MKYITPIFTALFAPWLVLGLSLTITFLLWQAEQKNMEQKVEARFQQETNTIKNTIIDRLKKYELMLRGSLGLFNASNFITRREWKMYVQALDPFNNYPGIQGIGFGQRVPDAEKQAHIRRLRAEGFPAYNIWPEGTRTEYFPVIYLEPFSDRNLRAFGYDMFSEPIRKAAMQEACDRGITTMSGKIRLVQETAQNVQAGFLIYLPLYEKKLPVDTQEERRIALRGFVYSPFRMDDFINGLVNWNTATLQWEIYDGPNYNADALLYSSSAAALDRPDSNTVLHKKSSCKLFGRTWSLSFRALPEFTASTDRSKLQFMLFACLTISFLLFGITLLIVARGKALTRDMARQKLAATELQQSKNKLLTILDTTPFPIALVDTQDNNITFWSRSALALFGQTAPTTSKWYEMAYPDKDYRREVTARWKPALVKARLSGQAVNTGEYRITCRDKSIRICELYATFLTDQLIVTFNDITKRKQVENALQESQRSLQTLISNIQGFVYRCHNDEFWTMQFISAGVKDLTGYSPDDFIDNTKISYADIIHPDDRVALNASVQQALQEKKQFQETYRIRTTKGEVKWVLEKGVGIYSPDGKIISLEGFITDITAGKKSQETLQTKNDELIRFTYTVSHDLKAPLVTIKTFLGYLEQSLAENNTQNASKDLGYIHSAADKMNALLEDLLNLGRIGSVENQPVETPLPAIAQEALDLIAGRISKRKVQVTITKKPCMLYGDRVRLVEVFQNLLDNAVQFMGDQDQPAIEIGTAEKDGETLFFVRDNGMGIDPRHIHKLFHMFQKLDANTKGTGIGLTLVKGIVELHGGRIWAESEGVGKGACFWFALPGKSSES